jgi:hypothetical protein
LVAAKEEEIHLHTSTISTKEEGVQGATALLGGRQRRPAAATASPSPSSSSGLHLFINNLHECFLLDLHHEG